MELKDFIKYIDKQVDEQQMSIWWILPNGDKFVCDVGFVCEWWEEFRKYLKKHKKEIEKNLQK